ncbi:MAG: glucokinase [Alphaproteobacteria bacterium]|nr:MAG: glucokinase [Alphaproteobacteria bacterium]
MNFLLSDIGGTNARFALTDGHAVSDLQILKTADYPNLTDAAMAYANEIHKKGAKIDRAVFSVGTAVVSDEIIFPNSPWSFSKSKLQSDMKLSRLDVMNDFKAVALSVPHVDQSKLIQIGGGKAQSNQPIGVIGPGTGLGVGYLLPDGHGNWIANSGEGGHVTAPAMNDLEWQVIQELKREKYTHVSAERIASGKGLINVHQALCAIHKKPYTEISAEEISKRAISGSDNLCKQALDIFCGMLGTVAGNLALLLGAHGGIYIAGGIVPQIMDYVQQSSFRERFENKGRRRDYLAAIPTYVITQDNLAFLGLSAYAKQHFGI